MRTGSLREAQTDPLSVEGDAGSSKLNLPDITRHEEDAAAVVDVDVRNINTKYPTYI